MKAQRAVLEAQETALEEQLRQADANITKRGASLIVSCSDDRDAIDLTLDDWVVLRLSTRLSILSSSDLDWVPLTRLVLVTKF